MKKSLTIEDLKNRIGKPVFVVCLLYNCKEWRILKNIGFGKMNTLEFTDDTVIREDLQGNFRFFDEEVTETELVKILESETELAKILESEEKLKKKTGYETVGKGNNYFFITSYMKAIIGYAYHWNDSDDVAREACGNHFNDETLAINLARAERLKYQLRRFAALNGGIPSAAEWFSYSSWEDGNNYKYFIEYDYEEQKMKIDCTLANKSFGQVYFKNKQACEKALETFKHELLWYFTEFKEMLY